MEILNLNECASCNFLTQSLKLKAKSHSVKFKALNFELWFYALRFTLFAILVSLCFLNCPAAQAEVGQNYIEQWGITWTFDKNISKDGSNNTYKYGTFINGDYWVIGPVNITKIEPLCHVTVAGEKDEVGYNYTAGIIINGSEINPLSTVSTQGYISMAYGYISSLNKAWTISSDNPEKAAFLTVAINSSLISTGSRVADSNQSVVKRAQILTVLPPNAFDNLPNGVTPDDCFRPHYFGIGPKVVLHYAVDGYMDDTFLANDMPLIAEKGQAKPKLTGPAKDWGMIDQFARPWIKIGIGHTSRAIHPADNMPDYWFQTHTNNAARVLNSSDYTLEQKRPLLINYVQCGIDLFGQYVEGSHGNGPDGGIHVGLMLPMLAFGRAFNYQPVWDMFAKAGNYRYSVIPDTNPVEYYNDGKLPPDYNFIQELDQTFYITQRDVDITNNLFRGVGEYLYGMPLWSPDTRSQPNTRYTVDMIGIPEWGIRQATSPYLSDALFPNSAYRGHDGNGNMGEYFQTQIAVLAWGLKAKINYNAWFDFTDRGAAYFDTLDGDPCIRTWLAYRDRYGPIWPEKAVIVYGDVSGDSALSAYDAALAARIAVGLDAYPMGDNLTKADVSGDGSVTAYDAALIAQRAVGLISKFPVES